MNVIDLHISDPDMSCVNMLPLNPIEEQRLHIYGSFSYSVDVKKEKVSPPSKSKVFDRCPFI